MSAQGDGGSEARPKTGPVIHELASAVVSGFCRLVKACQFHTDTTNEVVTSLTAAAELSVQTYCQFTSAETAAISFLGDAVFVNRQILKASRDVHTLALVLGELLERFGVTEISFAKTVTGAPLCAFAKLVADAEKDPSAAARITSGEFPGIVAGKAKFAGAAAAAEESPGQRAARTYATSVLTVQGALADLREGKFELPRKIKRVAQQIVVRADEDARLLVALAATGGVSLDTATIAVSSAILAVAMARQLTTDRGILTSTAMATLLLDAGRVRLEAASGRQSLNDDEMDAVPARTVVAVTALGRMHTAARARTALLYEVWRLRRAHRLGPLYKGKRPPSLVARLVLVARAFAELRGAGAGGGLSVDDALQVLSNRAIDGTDRALVKLLTGALGIYPAGTMVTLNTGEQGVVLSTPAAPLDYVRPQVKILYDARGGLLETPVDVDLAAPREGEILRFVCASVDADEQQAKVMREYVVAAMAARQRNETVEAGVTVRPAAPPVVRVVPEPTDANMRATMPVPAAPLVTTKPEPPPRRRDPRNDTTPPSSMTDEVAQKPVVIRHVVTRMVSTPEPPRIETDPAPPTPPEPAEGLSDWLLPPSPSQVPPVAGGESADSHTYDVPAYDLSAPALNAAPTAPPPLPVPAEDKLPDPSNEHDSLLAAFLAGATIPPAPDSKPPPKDPKDGDP